MRTKKKPVAGADGAAAIRIASTDVEMLPVAALKSYAHNPRTHDDRQIEEIKSSMTTFGFIGTVLTDDDNVIICGHAWVEAVRRLGMAEVPALRVSHLSEAEVRALRIAENRLAEKAGWSQEMLQIEFGWLEQQDLSFDLDVTGFSFPEIDGFLSLEAGSGGDDDVTPERIAVSRPGDLWICGVHRLLCGSTEDPASVLRVMAGERAQVIFTDVPYNISSKMIRGKHPDFLMCAGEMTTEAYQTFLEKTLGNLTAALVDGGIAFVAIDWRSLYTLETAARAIGLTLINMAVWNKTNGGLGSLYRSKYELFPIYKKGKAAHVNAVMLGRYGRNRTNVWDYPGCNAFGRTRQADIEAHGTVKPVPLIADALRDVSHRGAVVLDGFFGSGGVMLAAERIGRKARGVELDPVYVDVAVKRWEKLTGCHAMLEATGQSFAEVTADRQPKMASDDGEVDPADL